MRWIIKVRNKHPAFGRGDFTFLPPENRKVLAYLRCHEGETILCVANLSETAQAVELDLPGHVGRTPADLFGGALFPAIGSERYMLTLPGYSFLWLQLIDPADTGAVREQPDLVAEEPQLPSAIRVLPRPSEEAAE